MGKIILRESQLKRLMETGSNSAAMDLDIYVQPVQYDTSNGNEDVVETLENTIGKLQELISMFKGGKKVHPELKNRFSHVLDLIDKNFSNIKYQD